MPFSAERTTEIKLLIRSRLERQDVNDWERPFLSNMDAKFAKYGTRTSLSKAQYAKLHKILGLERVINKAPARVHAPSNQKGRGSRSASPQNPIKATKRAINAPRRAVRRAERQLFFPLVVIVAAIALLGSIFSSSGNNPAPTIVDYPEASVPGTSYVFVTGSTVNQRRGPSTSYPVIGSLAEGMRVEVLSRDGQWIQVRSNLGDGWMASRYLSSQRPSPSSEAVPEGSIRANAVRVVDGDTIEYGGQSIRLLGFDTPETYYADCPAEKARGDAATARLRELVRRAGSLQLFLRDERDRYGRGLGRLFVDGQDVGDLLISEGLARRYSGRQRGEWC